MISHRVPSIAEYLEALASLPDRIVEKLRPIKPYDFLKAQPESFADILPYEGFLALDRPTCLLSDGSLGLVWELSPLPHEVMDERELERTVTAAAELVEKMRNERVALQFIFDAEPSREFTVMDTLASPETSAERILASRVSAVAELATHPQHRLRLMRRRVLLTARLEERKSSRKRAGLGQARSEVEVEARRLADMAEDLRQIGDEIEYTLHHAGIKHRVIEADDLLEFLRATFHSADERASSELLAREEPRTDVRLGQQVLRDFIELTPRGVGVGEDAWEAASWLDQPPTVFNGLWARLMEIDSPHRLVVNIRTCTDTGDLETKKVLLKNATDSFGELQRAEVKATQDRLARGESLSFVSIHLFVRNYGVKVDELAARGEGRTLVSRLKTLTQVDFLLEKHAAPAVFLLSLPLAHSRDAAGFLGREKRVLSRNVGPYLPLFGGFQGTRTPLQLMVSRGGDAVWLNAFDSQTSPHVAVLASSGGGKSFFAENMMMSFFAKEGRNKPFLFVIDRKTSYEIFARVLDKDVGSQVTKPPEEFPNIFKGKIDDYRLPVIVGILKTAVSLVSENASLGAIEEMVLADAVRSTFEQSELDARTEYADGRLRERKIGKVRIPRLSDVVENLFPVCGKSGTPVSVAQSLAGYLSPFVASGPYARLFDREDFEEFDPPTPGISLYDIDAVASHPVFSTLTTQIILSEILRQIRRPENRGRPGMLVIEEAGVLAEGSPELVRFIQDAWKTFRKLGFSCVGLTNEVDDYVRKAGPREIWNVSPNKVILKMTDKDLQKALSGNPEAGYPPLIEDSHMGKLIASLKKEDGAYSQGLWWSDETKGTFMFIPTGFDYWCAASKPVEVNTVFEVSLRFADAVNPFFEAVSWLATHYPRGVRNADGTLRVPREDELPASHGRAS